MRKFPTWRYFSDCCFFILARYQSWQSNDDCLNTNSQICSMGKQFLTFLLTNRMYLCFYWTPLCYSIQLKMFRFFFCTEIKIFVLVQMFIHDIIWRKTPMQNKTTNDSEWMIALDVPYNLLSHSFRNVFRATWHSRAPHESAHISMISSSGSSTQLYSNCASRMSFSRKTRLFCPHFSLKREAKDQNSVCYQESSINLRNGKIRCVQN